MKETIFCLKTTLHFQIVTNTRQLPVVDVAAAAAAANQ